MFTPEQTVEIAKKMLTTFPYIKYVLLIEDEKGIHVISNNQPFKTEQIIDSTRKYVGPITPFTLN